MASRKKKERKGGRQGLASLRSSHARPKYYEMCADRDVETERQGWVAGVKTLWLRSNIHHILIEKD